jgi:hypothetical protein
MWHCGSQTVFYGRTQVKMGGGTRPRPTARFSLAPYFTLQHSAFSIASYFLSAASVVIFLVGGSAFFCRSFRCSSIFRRGTPFTIQAGAGAPFR